MAQWQEIDNFLIARGIQVGKPTLGQTTGGTHTAGSEHYQGRARDYGRSNSAVGAIVAALVPYAQGPNHVIDELFSAPENVFYDKGVAFTPSASLRNGHIDHVHVGMRAGAHFGDAPPSSSPGSSSTSSGGAAAGLEIKEVIGNLLEKETAMRVVKFLVGLALLAVGVWQLSL